MAPNNSLKTTPCATAAATASAASLLATKSSGGTKKEGLVGGGSRTPMWRPWPWNTFPDFCAGIIGLMFLIPPAPFMGVLIGSGELSWAIIGRLANVFPIHVHIKAVIMSLSKSFAARYMKDPRNYNYIPHIVWLSIWAPTLYSYAIYRT
jgi:hypothetical protein